MSISMLWCLEQLSRGGVPPKAFISGRQLRFVTPTHNVQVAVKFVYKQVMRQDEYWAKYVYRESTLMRRLFHPNVIQVLTVV